VKSQINLLHKDFVPKFEWVCAQHFFGLIVLVLVLCAGTFGLVSYYHHTKEAEVAQIKREIAQQQTSIEELTEALTSRVTDPELENKLDTFAEQTRSRGLLLKHIRNLSELKQRSFSVLFDSLAKSSSSKLWLTNFLVKPNELNIEGQLSNPRALPLWISALSKTDFFKGQEFNLATVEREDSVLSFQLKSVDKNSVGSLAKAGAAK
jgi:Tfp pilus assembly protein PilN